jgi:PilZ domain
MTPSPERRRSPRIALNIAVTVGLQTPAGEWRLAEAYTLSVSAHGGLVELGFKVVVGEIIVLINPRTGKRQEARILEMTRSQPNHYAVAFEFLDPAAAFWPILSFQADQTG